VDEQERMRKKPVMALLKATISASAWTKKPPSTQNLSTNYYTASGSSNLCAFLQYKQNVQVQFQYKNTLLINPSTMVGFKFQLVPTIKGFKFIVNLNP
jgi:hypothetical protein